MRALSMTAAIRESANTASIHGLIAEVRAEDAAGQPYSHQPGRA